MTNDHAMLPACSWAGAMSTKNAPTHVLSAYRNQIATTRPNQV